MTKHTEERTKTHACDCKTHGRTHACDCISRKELLKKQQIIIDEYGLEHKIVHIGKIIDAPSVEPERKTGKWEYVVSTADVYGKWVCSECNKLIIGSSTQKPQHNYCPMCGAKMEVDNGLDK